MFELTALSKMGYHIDRVKLVDEIRITYWVCGVLTGIVETYNVNSGFRNLEWMK